MISSVDIGNPIYNRTPPPADGGEGVAKCEIFFNSGERSEFHSLDYQWTNTPDGIEVTCQKPHFDEYILGPDDLDFDIRYAIEADLCRNVRQLTWM